jgi:hypothetical protein
MFFDLLVVLVVFAAGLIVAWNFLEQPPVVKAKVDTAVAAAKKKLNG